MPEKETIFTGKVNFPNTDKYTHSYTYIYVKFKTKGKFENNHQANIRFMLSIFCPAFAFRYFIECC